MVDSENSTSLRSVSRRDVLGGIAAAPSLSLTAQRQDTTDPIVPLWRDWQRLHARTAGFCKLWQSIESHLVTTIGFPLVRVPSAEGSTATFAHSHAEIDRALADRQSSPRLRSDLHEKFAALRVQWDAEARRLGLDEARQREDDAWEEEARTVRAIFRTRATTLSGIEIKLALMAELCSTGSDDPDFPLPQLRSTLADVKRLRRNLGH